MSRSRHCFQSQCIIVSCHAMPRSIHIIFIIALHFEVALIIINNMKMNMNIDCAWCVRGYGCMYVYWEHTLCIVNEVLRQHSLYSRCISFNRLWCQPLNWYTLYIHAVKQQRIHFLFVAVWLNEMKEYWRVKCRSYQVRNVGFGKLHQIKDHDDLLSLVLILTCPTAILCVVLNSF